MKRVEQSHLAVAAATHPGMTGKNNEDRYAVSAYQLKTRRSEPALFAILADGIGGHRAGEVAAEMAVNKVSQQVAASDGLRPVATLGSAIRQVSQEIYTRAQSDPALGGMGATCACAWIIHDRLYTATVGDSRLYLVRQGAIQRLSTDHTWIQEALEKGILDPEQVHNHPNAHVIRRYLGSPQPPEVDFRLRRQPGEDDLQAASNQGLLLQEGDQLLICSDGLTDLVEDAEILSTLEQEPPESAEQSLIALANQRGGHDNITVIAIQVPAGALRQPADHRLRFVVALALLVTLAAIGAVLLLGQDIWGWLLPGGPTQAVLGTQAPATQVMPVIPQPATATSPTGPGASSVPTLSSPSATTPGGIKGLPSLTPVAFATPPGPTLTPWPTSTAYP